MNLITAIGYDDRMQKLAAARHAIEQVVETLSDLKQNPFHTEWDELDEGALEWSQKALHFCGCQEAELHGNHHGEFAGGYSSGGYYD